MKRAPKLLQRSTFALLAVCAWAVFAQPARSPAPAPALAAPVGGGPNWSTLSAGQRSALAPLQRDWPSIDAERKQKWLEVAERFPRMPEGERARMQARMSDWARMSPRERGQVRLRYQEAQRIAPEERQQRWEAYQALSAEQRRQLAAGSSTNADSRRAGTRSRRDESPSKSNIVPNPSFASPPKQVAPAVVQAKPGASTTLMSRRAAPPSHQQPGLPKIAASPGFVDRSTLLPQRGSQGAAARPAQAVPGQRADRSPQR